jgi:hypothetical protein
MSPSAAFLASASQSSWRDLYLQAVFENDRTKAPALIAEAERALVRRECELFSNPREAAEREAINSALHALRLLRNCLRLDHSQLAA